MSKILGLVVPSIACRSSFAARCLASSSKAGGSEAAGGSSKSKSKTSKAATATSTVTSSDSLGQHLPPNEPAGNEYKVPEYFQHDINSYADFFVQMSQQRLPRPVRPGRN